jgi:hypothetical protein
MKKILKITIFTLMITMLAVGPALAQTGTIYVKGKVLSYEDGTLIVEANQGELIVTVPDGLDADFFEAGNTVLIKGNYGSSGLIEAVFIQPAVRDGDSDQPEGSKDNGYYCSEDNQDQPHPLVSSIAERYNVKAEEVEGYFCGGYSIGAIMMALQTGDIEDVEVDWSEFLAYLADGYLWDQIWENIGLIDNDQGEQSVAGLVIEPQPSPTEVAPEPTSNPAEEDGSAPQPSPTEAGGEPEPTSAPVVNEPEPTPTEVVNEPEPTPAAVASEPEPTPATVVSEPEPSPTEVVVEPDPAPPGKPTKDPTKTKVDVGDDDNNDQD